MKPIEYFLIKKGQNLSKEELVKLRKIEKEILNFLKSERKNTSEILIYLTEKKLDISWGTLRNTILPDLIKRGLIGEFE